MAKNNLLDFGGDPNSFADTGLFSRIIQHYKIEDKAIGADARWQRKVSNYKWMGHATKPHNYNAFMFVIATQLVLCEYSKFRMESNSYFSIRFDSLQNEHSYSKFLNTYRHRFLTYLTEWRRFFTLATMPSNQQNLLLTMVQVLYLLEVFILVHYYGPPSTETPTTTIVQCHKKQLNLFNKYLLLVNFETNDNYSILFRISNNSSTIQFHSIWSDKTLFAQH